MTYHFSKTVDMRFDDAVICTKDALKRHNFRVISEIDMKDNFKTTINIDFIRILSSAPAIQSSPIWRFKRKTRSEPCYPATSFFSSEMTDALRFPRLIPLLPCRPSHTSS